MISIVLYSEAVNGKPSAFIFNIFGTITNISSELLTTGCVLYLIDRQGGGFFVFCPNKDIDVLSTTSVVSSANVTIADTVIVPSETTLRSTNSNSVDLTTYRNSDSSQSEKSTTTPHPATPETAETDSTGSVHPGSESDPTTTGHTTSNL